MEILVKDAAITKDLEEIGDTVRECYPDDYAQFITYVKDQASHLLQANGMSTEGTIMNFMKIPTVHAHSDGKAISLYEFIKIWMRQRHGIQDFFRDSDNYRLLCRVWRDAYVKKKLGSKAPIIQGASE